MNLQGKRILITGGTSGIGLESVQHFLAQGMTVMVCGRNGTKLQAVKRQFPKVVTISCDITVENELHLLYRLIMNNGGIDILYHNAGIVHINNMVENPVESGNIAQREMETNYLAVLRLTSMFLPHLQKRSEPALIFTTSAVAYLPAAFIPTYSASKAALHSYIQSLRYQLKQSKSHLAVVELIPPTVDTEATQKLTTKKVTSSEVIKELIKGLRRNRETIRVSIAKPFYWIQRFFPFLAFKILNPKNPFR
jgi:uncharacterized oxidoreductase